MSIPKFYKKLILHLNLHEFHKISLIILKNHQKIKLEISVEKSYKCVILKVAFNSNKIWGYMKIIVGLGNPDGKYNQNVSLCSSFCLYKKHIAAIHN